MALFSPTTQPCAVLDSLPKVPYLTLMDKYFSCCYIAISAAAVETCAVFQLGEAGYERSTVWRIDLACFAASLFCFLALSAWLMWRGTSTRDEADTDRDGFVSPEELAAAHAKHGGGGVSSFKAGLIQMVSRRKPGNSTRSLDTHGSDAASSKAAEHRQV